MRIIWFYYFLIFVVLKCMCNVFVHFFEVSDLKVLTLEVFFLFSLCFFYNIPWVDGSLKNRLATLKQVEDIKTFKLAFLFKMQHWCGNVGETSERWSGVNVGFSERIDTTLNWTELTHLF